MTDERPTARRIQVTDVIDENAPDRGDAITNLVVSVGTVILGCLMILASLVIFGWLVL